MVEGLTLAELAETAAAVLGDESGGDEGAARVRPTQRTLRYYAAQRLLDPPLELRGPRSAYYGRRHLLQVVAVKKLQAAGRSLDEIRGLLAGASNERLQELAGIPEPALTARAAPAALAVQAPPTAPAAPTPSLTAAEMPPGFADAPHPTGVSGASPVTRTRPGAFWCVTPDSAPLSAQLPRGRDDHDPQVHRAAAGPLLTGVPVGPVVVLLPAARLLDAADLSALVDAARPLLAALADRGLLATVTNPATQRSTP
ncbi:MAG: helix-turn-helix domain-containing protein [Frankiaceae bacterium]